MSSEIAIIAGFALSLELLGRNNRKVRRRERHVEKKRGARRMLGRLLDILHAAARKLRQDVDPLPVRQTRPGDIEFGTLFHGRDAIGAIVLDVAEGWIVGDIRAEVVIEAARGGTVGDGLGEIDVG